MPQPLMVERLAWEPGPLIKATDLNSLVDWTRSRRKGRLTPTLMAPKEVWRLLYLTQPLNTSAASAAGEVKLGHLDIAWRTTMGETGHLLTFPCMSNIPHYSDVSMNVVKLPAQVVVEDPFQMVCEITNRSFALIFSTISTTTYFCRPLSLFSSRVLELMLSRPETSATTATAGGYETTSDTTTTTGAATAAVAVTAAAFPAFIWTGVTYQRLPSLAPATSTQLTLEFVPVMTGLQGWVIVGVLPNILPFYRSDLVWSGPLKEVPPFELKEISTEGCFTFSNLGWVLVTSAPAA
ncbi:unnamed protein product [Hydatigera taeniaeformis]|uniref:Trafficking protein particle complex subunit 13 middle domain-containing protein n=1 Tax=Hydatigena taeniaeformis TaxID=6205 RepID=A0A0R3X709_HYDTA|nr:unnamed protein product [Hydatigera taeniaeformis]